MPLEELLGVGGLCAKPAPTMPLGRSIRLFPRGRPQSPREGASFT